MSDEKSRGMLVLGIVAVVAVVGVVLLVGGRLTGAPVTETCKQGYHPEPFWDVEYCGPCPTPTNCPPCHPVGSPVGFKCVPNGPGLTGAQVVQPPRAPLCGCTPVNRDGICNVYHPIRPGSDPSLCLKCPAPKTDLHVGGC
ncbi:hypothetical protein HY642_01015 [Candidatus Woesearchaeota archaeon]|nr:hypothetical protein [Candidatus Woesearchaeota archaeon]